MNIAPPMTHLAPQGDREIRIERIFNASRERVWRAMTEPTLIAQWWGRGNTLIVDEYDLRPGGRWRFVEHADDMTHAFHGYFREITPLERVVQTFQYEPMPGFVSAEEMTLTSLADGATRCDVVVRFHFPADRDFMIRAMVGPDGEGGIVLSHRALDRVLSSMT